MQQAEDFRQESVVLYELLAGIPTGRWNEATLFKGWTADDILQHLHFWNGMAALQVTDPDRLIGLIDRALSDPRGMHAFETSHLNGLSGTALLDAWIDGANTLADRFSTLDPKARLKWAGPDMSARSSITARLMETWAHGQALFDLHKTNRPATDRLKNIAVLGVNTYGWSFANRGEPAPAPMPYIRLTAPSGDIWEFGEVSDAERITGPAEAFCQVVTQTRNVADTGLTVTGPNARAWMARAQCFAGPPHDPPAPGVRTA
ncbi:TIGR03084 family protein [Rhodospirillaceae bacterium KN72]|uniref:TIGR03084 family protein n=1 Tax=Pacificispira spongiicola TaxID=2729598 RepID=A0A7Y0HF68_9PROT|nr:TIGR03084 family metal-binding protein [Pacificispira spongiicola]NMM42924.1 TIGR03084 family protein [Pacificispira spongiicola]